MWSNGKNQEKKHQKMVKNDIINNAKHYIVKQKSLDKSEKREPLVYHKVLKGA